MRNSRKDLVGKYDSKNYLRDLGIDGENLNQS
jgi:hypothetical protein